MTVKDRGYDVVMQHGGGSRPSYHPDETEAVILVHTDTPSADFC